MKDTKLTTPHRSTAAAITLKVFISGWLLPLPTVSRLASGPAPALRTAMRAKRSSSMSLRTMKQRNSRA